MRIFLLKAKRFIKRNIYPITVTTCTALMIAIISISAYSSINKSTRNISVVTTDNRTKIETPKEDDDKGDNKIEENEKNDDSKAVVSDDTIIFDLPFKGATISKEYAENKLLYDATTKFWCTHQAIDFACSDGQAVVAVADGTIIKVENSMMNGTVVYLKISDKLTVVYKGLASGVNVKEGDVVKKGHTIGTVTSMLSEKADGVHLHLEVVSGDKLVDPTEYFSFNK